MSRWRRTRLGFLLGAAIVLSFGVSACLAAAAGAAGGGFYFTNRGAEGVLQGTVAGVAAATADAFAELSVERTGERSAGNEGGGREIYGTAGEDDVTVELRRETDSTVRVEVRVRTSAVTWDREMARRILESIQEAN